MRIRTPQLSPPARTLVAALVTLVALSDLIVGAHARTPTAAVLDQMVEAERAFARAAAEQGVRQAFLTFLAEDAISVQPYGRARAQWLARPAPPPGAKLAKLEWAPRTGEVSTAGDLGWLTGEFTQTPPTGAPRYGCYFSVWQRQSDGEWRVKIDVGVDTPTPVVFPQPGFTPAAPGVRRTVVDHAAGAGAGELLDADRALTADAAARGLAAALLDRAGVDMRLHRPGHLPAVGRDAVARHFVAAPAASMRVVTLEAGIAKSRDLGWTLGRYEPVAGAGESGYYLRVWRHEADGPWTIAADITQPSAS
jgi:ketosteroid isomerase-like protein